MLDTPYNRDWLHAYGPGSDCRECIYLVFMSEPETYGCVNGRRCDIFHSEPAPLPNMAGCSLGCPDPRREL